MMSQLKQFSQLFSNSEQLKSLIKKASECQKIQIEGTVGSSVAFIIKSLFESIKRPIFFVCEDKERAAYFFNDIEQLIKRENVLFYPSNYRRPYQTEKIDNANVLLRSEVLNTIQKIDYHIVITYPNALCEKVISKEIIEKNTYTINEGDYLELDTLNEALFEYDFKRVDFVSEPGEFSVRGGIVDVFSFSNNQPYRIEFFGNKISSIRSFNIDSQLSDNILKSISISPSVDNHESKENRNSILEFISKDSIVCFSNISAYIKQIDDFFEKSKTIYKTLTEAVNYSIPEELFCQSKDELLLLNQFTVLEYTNTPYYKTNDKIKFVQQAQPSFNKQFNLLIDTLNIQYNKGFENYITCTTEQQSKRFHDIFENSKKKPHYKALTLGLSSGFIDSDLKISCFTDHQIFDRFHKFKLKNKELKEQSISLKTINELNIGDYVVHIDHGIGKFAGLQKINVGDKTQEAILLKYGERDVMYVSIHSLHKISKYSGKDEKPPKIHKLGTKVWATKKSKTKKRVKQVAFDLIKLYAKRKLKKGFSFDPDSYLQYELEASFIYEDTPDQSTATDAVKADMESEIPMNRLVCGDVGFGKTEVAIRAAFKAVDNGKQVAVLVPTTILAFQHYKTFSQRLNDFPVTVDYLNRFRSSKEKTAILKNLEAGKIDIIISTHQLVNKSIQYKDLGLLIVDEEQKFGVSVKEKLKTLKENLDVLTLTATPIPRTLQFSLMAARDLSIIRTPPPNRYPIDNKFITFNEEAIRDATIFEIQRGGQVFFIHNRIENLKEVAGMLQRLVPDAKIAIGHGQMDGNKLEKIMLDFMEGYYHILVSTTIIENGLDIPNANTIFINNAHNFGLSDLHQMRGRVGRSNRKAFCYFITAPKTSMTEDARRRVSVLEEFSELGSGFNIAMKDLEIRGAGDLLGGEQSGFINDIGFETYQKILQEAIDELKENEFKDLYKDLPNKPYVRDVQIETDLELLFPDDYVNNVTERLRLYNTLGNIEDEDNLSIFEKNLKDRFGELPEQTVNLLDSVHLKWIAKKMGLERLIIKNKKMIGYFIADQQNDFYSSELFTALFQKIQKSNSCQIKEKETRNGLRLLVSFQKIETVEGALSSLKDL